ncbi:hypothetical protein OG992_33415 [Micromonospora sp. NBC_00362]|uniref:WD40 repeat domain-containing protein n=1 Tax=Micromonospora sp. NBC_00362 TaxID=2975975 RepID=UPI002255F124|nr:hypothetical protein [Micromonospora sp. NBC_00362]MCX5122064.1 hypothetical protein [Micromonospora sp. NBC_00362]
MVQQHVSMRCIGHTGAVRQLSWSPDGNLLASISDDEMLYIWHTQDGRPLGVLDTPDGIVRSLSWQDTLIVTYSDGRILSWDVCGGHAKRSVEDREPRALTAEERERYGLPSASTD